MNQDSDKGASEKEGNVSLKPPALGRGIRRPTKKDPQTVGWKPHQVTRDDEARTRFMQEAKAASALDHPNICTIHEIDETPDGQLFIAMGYYEGETLKGRIAKGPLPIEDALNIAIQMAQGLSKAHAAGIIHRDIKPANVTHLDRAPLESNARSRRSFSTPMTSSYPISL